MVGEQPDRGRHVLASTALRRREYVDPCAREAAHHVAIDVVALRLHQAAAVELREGRLAEVVHAGRRRVVVVQHGDCDRLLRAVARILVLEVALAAAAFALLLALRVLIAVEAQTGQITNVSRTDAGGQTIDPDAPEIPREDFARHRGDYSAPISTTYRGTRVWQCPPPGQGLTALLLLNILAESPLAADPLSAERFHTQIEASKLAYAERDRHIADPEHVRVPVKRLLARAHAQRLAAAIDPKRAMTNLPAHLLLPHPDTTYVTVVDKDRTAVSFINSIYYSFGSARVAPKSGVVLQNRGANFVIDPGHPNCIGPGKRPMHTIIPAMVTKGGKALVSFAVMGGHYQPVGQAQVLGNMLDYGMDPQAAQDFPRLFFENGGVTVEAGIPEAARVVSPTAGTGWCGQMPTIPMAVARSSPSTGSAAC
ncbi:MAG: hypothetical protein HC850_18090 [Rhodomicrobium sp.]|nr:hypothetical protein [Rhodomicrobium sp.]